MTKEDKRKVLAELDELARGTSGVVRETSEDCKRVIRHMEEGRVTKVYIAGKSQGTANTGRNSGKYKGSWRKEGLLC